MNIKTKIKCWIEDVKQIVFNNIIYLIIFAVVFLIGLVLGFIFSDTLLNADWLFWGGKDGNLFIVKETGFFPPVHPYSDALFPPRRQIPNRESTETPSFPSAQTGVFPLFLRRSAPRTRASAPFPPPGRHRKAPSRIPAPQETG